MADHFVGWEILTFSTLDSTNSYCRKLLESRRVTEGTVINALRQTQGRGQGNNSWESSPGENLTFSIILFPHFLDASRQFSISMVISLGITDFLKTLTREISIKWPNDIYFESKKIAGILIENSVTDSKIDNTIAGVGLNVNQTVFERHIPNPVSLRQIISAPPEPEECLERLCQKITNRYSMLKQGRTRLIKKEYTEQLFRINQEHRFLVENNIVRGFIRGVDSYGRMALESGNGTLRYFTAQEIKFLDL